MLLKTPLSSMKLVAALTVPPAATVCTVASTPPVKAAIAPSTIPKAVPPSPLSPPEFHTGIKVVDDRRIGGRARARADQTGVVGAASAIARRRAACRLAPPAELRNVPRVRDAGKPWN